MPNAWNNANARLRRTGIALRFLVAIFIFISGAAYAADPSTLPLVQQSNMVYQGAFRVPGDWPDNAHTLNSGGGALGFYPSHNSLFMQCHDGGILAEISIPQLVNSANIASLKTSQILQGCTDVASRIPTKSDFNYDAAIFGTQVVNGKLIVGYDETYDADGSQTTTHFLMNDPAHLSTSTITGMYKVGTAPARATGGYMGEIPAEWQANFGATHLTGLAGLSIRSTTSFGAAVTGFSAAQLGSTGANLPGTTYLYYPIDHPLETDDANGPWYGVFTAVRGVFFVPGTRSVLFFQSHGKGKGCYGVGTSNAALDGTTVPGSTTVYCYDPTSGYKGYHQYPYVAKVLAYDALDLLAVKSGQKQSWEIKPYADWELSLPFVSDEGNVGGVAYDKATGILYFSAPGADTVEQYSYLPVIHAFKIDLSGSTTPPAPPAPPPPAPAPLGTAPTNASIAADKTSCTAPCTVNLNGAATGIVDTWSWVFGNNTTGSGASTSAAYNSAGSYTVTLVAANSAGNSSASKTITVSAALSSNASATTGAVPATSTPPAPTSGLVAAYGMNDGSGTRVGDSSGNGLDGTANGTTWTTSGKIGKALSLNGNSFVDLGNPAALQLTGSMTVEGWINSSSFPGDDAAIVSKREGGQTGFQLDTTIDKGPRTIGFKLEDGATGASMFRYGKTAMVTGQWYHVAGVYDAAAKTMHVYLNGALDDGVAVGTVGGSQKNSAMNVMLGKRPGSTGYEFSGLMDELRIYSRALTQAEIQSDMNTAIAAPPPPVPHPPVAVNDSALATQNVATSIYVLSNDTDQDGDTLTIASVTTPAHGTAAISNGAVVYTSAASYTGSDNFSYVVSDGNSGTATGNVAVTVAAPPPPGTNYSYNNPKPLPTPTGTIVNVSTVSQLISAINNLTSNKTIVIAPGTYNLTNSGTDTLFLPQNLTNVSIRGATGNANDVILTGNNMSSSGSMKIGFWLQNVTNWTIADLTIKNAYSTGIMVNGNDNGGLIHNVRMTDIGDQSIKGNPPNGYGTGSDNVTVEYCIFRYSDPVLGENKDGGGQNLNYTEGIDIHGGSGWNVQYNFFENFFQPSSLAGPAVLFWNGSGLRSGNIVNGNTFVNNSRAVQMGLTQQASGRDNNGGVVSNNMVYNSSSTPVPDVAIGVFDSPNTQVVNNTIMTSGYPNGIEYRFGTTTGVIIRNNLMNTAIAARDGAAATVSSNVTNATNALFANPIVGDLHLLSTASVAIDKGVTLAGITTDIDGQTRSGTIDLGADEFVSGPTTPPANQPPVAVNDNAGTTTGTMVVVNVLANDTDADGDTLTISSVTTPGHGTAVIASGKVNFTPASGYSGSDSFSYTISDGHSHTATASIAMTVTAPPPPPPANVAPVAANDNVTTAANTMAAVNVLANDSDADGDTLTIASVTTPAHGTAVIASGKVNYTPTSGYSGADSFSYTISDGHSHTSTASVAMTVNAPPPPPPANKPPVVTISANKTSGVTPLTVTFTATASDPDGSIASYAWSFGDGTASAGATAAHAYKVAGTYSATATVTDNKGAMTKSAPVTITVVAPPPPPTAKRIAVRKYQFNTTAKGTAFAWTFGDGTTGTGTAPVHAYAKNGTYTVTLKVNNKGVVSKVVIALKAN